jgi:hypothetical protein
VDEQMRQAETLRHNRTPAWPRLGARTRTMVQWMNDCTLLREADLIRLVWPDEVSRQTRSEQLRRWRDLRLIQPIDDADGPCFQLGRQGARVLRQAGFPLIAPVKPLASRVRRSIIETNAIGAQLVSALRREPWVAGVSWFVRPFSGGPARADGVAAALYRPDGACAEVRAHAGSMPELGAEAYAPPAGYALQRLVLEYDLETESQQQLIERARRWRAVWDATEQPERTHTIFLWVTSGGMARLERIWTAWVEEAGLPACFSTSDLLWEGERWHGWSGLRYRADGTCTWVWRDSRGRPRSLNPLAMHEPAWRSVPPQVLTNNSLQEGIATWDRQCPPPWY